MIKNDRWEELADVFEGFAILAGQGFDAMFPDRERAKEQAIKWLNEARVTDLIVSREPAGADYVNINRLKESLETLKPVLEQKFPGAVVFPTALYNASQKWELSTKPKPVQPAVVSGSVQSNINAQEPLESPAQALVAGKKIALLLIEKEPLKSTGYRLLRTLRWDTIEKVPPAEAGKTQIAGPSNEQRTFFQGVVSKNDWQNALMASQKTFASAGNHLWLDLQRISVLSCKGLGTTYDSVRDAILFDTATLLKRIPGIQDLKFIDNSLFCDPATQDWIKSDLQGIFSSGEKGSSKASSPAAQDGVFLEEESKQLNSLIAAGKVEPAIDFLQKQIRASGSERDNFRRSILLGHVLVTNKRPDIALAILESLDEKIAAFNLEKWDPALAVEAWILLFDAYKAAKAAKPQNLQIAILEKQNTILQKISRTDPKSAFRITA
jgi:type VI secretion system protein VasJ